MITENSSGGVTTNVTTSFEEGLRIEDYKYLSEVINRQKTRKELGIENDDFLLISVGELSERKNQIVVLKAMAGIYQKNPEAGIKYILVGKGSLEGEYKQFIKEHGLEKYVQLLGFRSDIADLLHASDLFAFPSLQEGLPVALMEAMASGINVICSRIRGNTDLVNEGLFNPDDVAEIEKQIKEAMGKEISRENPKIIQNFSIEKVQKDMRRIYSNL